NKPDSGCATVTQTPAAVDAAVARPGDRLRSAVNFSAGQGESRLSRMATCAGRSRDAFGLAELSLQRRYARWASLGRLATDEVLARIGLTAEYAGQRRGDVREIGRACSWLSVAMTFE